MALPTRHQGDPGLAGEAGIGIGHMHGGGFLAGVDQLDSSPQQGVEDRHDVVAREGEDRSHPGPRQPLDQRIRPPDRLAHFFTFEIFRD
nr:hypothetical protein [Siccirubricoccus sp. G192]